MSDFRGTPRISVQMSAVVLIATAGLVALGFRAASCAESRPADPQRPTEIVRAEMLLKARCNGETRGSIADVPDGAHSQCTCSEVPIVGPTGLVWRESCRWESTFDGCRRTESVNAVVPLSSSISIPDAGAQQDAGATIVVDTAQQCAQRCRKAFDACVATCAGGTCRECGQQHGKCRVACPRGGGQ